MKFSSAVVFLATIATGSAFVVPNSAARATLSTARFVVSEPEVSEKSEAKAPEPEAKADVKVAAPAKIEEDVKVVEKFVPEPSLGNVLVPGRYDSIDYSITLPFLQKPDKLDGSHAGDFGFDPLGLTEQFDIYYMQECELRHARLAMLAVVGWPLSELIAPDFMLQDGRAPSVLNGVNPISGLAILAFLGYIGTLEFFTWNRRTAGTPMGDVHYDDMKNIWKDGIAGDYNFDPAGLYDSLGDDPVGRKAMRVVEVTQGRYAMLAISYFALWEALTGSPIVENNPFFHPNGFLPIAGLAYLVGSTLYEFSDLRTFPVNIQKSKLGHDLDEWLERRAQSKM